MSTMTRKNRRWYDRAPFMSRMTVLWLNLRHAIKHDPALQENLWFGACGIVALIGLVLARGIL